MVCAFAQEEIPPSRKPSYSLEHQANQLFGNTKGASVDPEPTAAVTMPEIPEDGDSAQVPFDEEDRSISDVRCKRCDVFCKRIGGNFQDRLYNKIACNTCKAIEYATNRGKRC